MIDSLKDIVKQKRIIEVEIARLLKDFEKESRCVISSCKLHQIQTISSYQIQDVEITVELPRT